MVMDNGDEDDGYLDVVDNNDVDNGYNYCYYYWEGSFYQIIIIAHIMQLSLFNIFIKEL